LKAFNSPQVAYDCGQWLKAKIARIQGFVDKNAENYCESRGLFVTNAMGEGTGAAGGYVTPAPVSASIIAVRDMVGVARKVCDVVPMNSDTQTIPKRSAGLTVYAPGEGNAITDSDATFAQVEVIAKKRAVASYISRELNDDSLISIVDYVFTEMGYALANQEDNELINGTGAATTYFGVTGLLSSIGTAGVSTAATGHDTWPELDIADFAATVSKLPDRFHQYNPVWICSASFYYATMARIAFSAGGVSMSEVLAATPTQRSFMGYPVHLSAQMPVSTAAATKCCLFGSFNQGVVLGDRGGIQVDRSDDYRFLNDQITLKGTSRYDIRVHQPGTASAAGAYVALATAS
jgi:HK97 family phage major capsid protein